MAGNVMNNTEIDVNDRQERFCQLYASDLEFFGNGVETYLEVYDIDRSKPNWYKTACAAASRLLTNVNVIDRINELLSEQGLNDCFVDKQLKFLLTQHADFGSKMRAIQEYNKLKQRIVNKTDITTLGESLNAFSEEDKKAAALLNELEKNELYSGKDITATGVDSDTMGKEAQDKE